MKGSLAKKALIVMGVLAVLLAGAIAWWMGGAYRADVSALAAVADEDGAADGVTVRELQAYFGFEYPQAIYKWQHGECLPSVDNLLALARVLRVPMEDRLVYDDREVSYFWRLAQTYSAA